MSIAIIGCGIVGSAISEQLIRRKVTNKIKLIDLDIKKTKKTYSYLKSLDKKIILEKYQANGIKKNDLANIIIDDDLVINAASPLCNIPIMTSCLKTDTNYIDLASDPFEYPDLKGTSFSDQLKLHDSFKKKKLLAITNTGFAPGLTDLLSKNVVNEYLLDQIDYIKIYLAEKIISKKFVVSWSPYMFLLESISPPTVYINKKIETIETENSFRKIIFPKPIGNIKLTVFSGHPELKTIPFYLDIPIDYIEICGGYILNDMEFNEIIIKALRDKIGKSIIFNGDIFEILSTSFENPDEFINNYKTGNIKNEYAACIFKLKGKKGNKTFEYKAIMEHNLKDVYKIFCSGSVSSFMVSIIPAILAEKIINKKISQTGVIAPAGLKNVNEIIEECKKFGLSIKESNKWF